MAVHKTILDRASQASGTGIPTIEDIVALPISLDHERPLGVHIHRVRSVPSRGTIADASSDGEFAYELVASVDDEPDADSPVLGRSRMVYGGDAVATTTAVQAIDHDDTFDLLEDVIVVAQFLGLRVSSANMQSEGAIIVGVLWEPVELTFDQQLRAWNDIENSNDTDTLMFLRPEDLEG